MEKERMKAKLNTKLGRKKPGKIFTLCNQAG